VPKPLASPIPWRSDRGFAVQLLLVALLALATSLVFTLTGLDVAVSGRFHRFPAVWECASGGYCRSMYRFGTWPGIAVGAGAAVIAAGSLWVRPWRRWWREATAVALTLAIGSGVVVNLIGKDHLGRPRPREVTEFGGISAYIPAGMAGDGGGHSFPCGHASAAFALCALFVVLRRRAPRAAAACLVGVLTYGVALGYARLSEGAHFLSDVLWSFYATYLTALLVWAAISRLPAPAAVALEPAASPGALAQRQPQA
jgi:membrane-associated PAP2 superfamily phosphatase